MKSAILLICVSFFLRHDIHLSNTIINYNDETETFQISTHLFLDDLEASLRLEGHENLKLCTRFEKPEGDAAVASFLDRNLKIIISGDTLNLNYLGKEISEDFQAAWCYLESDRLDPPASVRVYNNYLHDIFDDQRNLVNIKHNARTVKTGLLDKSTRAINIKF